MGTPNLFLNPGTTDLPISGRLSTTNYVKENAVDYRSLVTIENNLKVKKGILFWKQAQVSSSRKNAWGTHRDKHTKKRENNN